MQIKVLAYPGVQGEQGEHLAPGSVVDVSPAFARQLVGEGRAAYVDPAPVAGPLTSAMVTQAVPVVDVQPVPAPTSRRGRGK